MQRRWFTIAVICVLVVVAALSVSFIYTTRHLSETGTMANADINATAGMDSMPDNMTDADEVANDSMSAGDMVSNDTMTSAEPTGTSSTRKQVREITSSLIWCDQTQFFDTLHNCSQIATYLSHLKIADAGWVSPDHMYVGETKEVRFAISRDSLSIPVAAILGSTPTETAKVKASRLMSASLDGAGFDVSPKGVLEKDTLAGAASWTWKVTALDNAEHDLDLSVFVDIPDGLGKPTQNLVRVLHRTMHADVTTSQRFQKAIATATDSIKSLTAFAIAVKALVLAILAILVVVGLNRRSGAAKKDTAMPPTKDDAN